nr:MAG: DNA pilot protein [Microvirus sp.]
MGVNLWQQHEANEQNVQMQQNINQQNAELQQSINDQNIQNQQQTLQQQQQFSREAAAQSDAYTRGLYRDLYSPQAKVKQLRQAGLSVGLMYGQGGTGGTSSTAGAQAATPAIQPAMAQAPRMNAPVINPALMNVTDLLKALEDLPKNLKTEKEIEVMDAQIEKIEAETNSTILSSQGTELDNQLKKFEIKIKEATTDTQIEILKQELENLKTNQNKTKEEIENLKVDRYVKERMLNISEEQNKYQIAKMVSETSKNIAEKALAESRAITDKELRNRIEAETQQILRQTEELNLRIEKAEIDMKYYEMLRKAEAELMDLKQKIEKWEFNKKEILLGLMGVQKLINSIMR